MSDVKSNGDLSKDSQEKPPKGSAVIIVKFLGYGSALFEPEIQGDISPGQLDTVAAWLKREADSLYIVLQQQAMQRHSGLVIPRAKLPPDAKLN